MVSMRYAALLRQQAHRATNEVALDMSDADCSSLMALCSLKEKREVEKLCRTLTIRQTDFVQFILLGKTGGLAPYRYACHFEDRPIAHLIPTDEERGALATNGLGPLQGQARKALTKMSQFLRDRRHLSAHLFYTPDHVHWNLFHFDQRDISPRSNHWEHGAHIHYASDLWIDEWAGDIWQQVQAGKQRFRTFHIRYQGRQ
jgi:hypothetical protein